MNSTLKRPMQRKLSLVLMLALLMALIPWGGLPARAAIANPTVAAAIAAQGYTQGVYSITISNDPSIIGTLDLNELKTDFPNLAYIDVRNTNITNVITNYLGGSGVSQVLTGGTFASGDRTLSPSPSSAVNYSLVGSGSGINLDELIAALQPNVSDGTTAAAVIDSLVGWTISDSASTPLSGSSGGIISDSNLASALRVGSYTLRLELAFKNTTWTHAVNYSLTITDISYTLTPDSVSLYPGGSQEFTLKKFGEDNSQIPVGSPTDYTITVNDSSGNSLATPSGFTAALDGNELKVIVSFDSGATPGVYTLTVTDNTSGKSVTASLNVQQLPAVTSLELRESNGSSTVTTIDPIMQRMYIKGGTSISSVTAGNLSVYTGPTDYLLYDGTNGQPLGDEYCSAFTVTDSSGNVTGELISVGGNAVLRVAGTAAFSTVITGSFGLDSSILLINQTIDYTINPATPTQYAIYMLNDSISATQGNVQDLINNTPSAVTEVAVYAFDNIGSDGWYILRSTPAEILEQTAAYFVLAAQYADGQPYFVVPHPAPSWYEGSASGLVGSAFDGTAAYLSVSNDITGQALPSGSNFTSLLRVNTLAGSGNITVNAAAQLLLSGMTNTLYFEIRVTPREIVRYEFANSNGGTLGATDSQVPIGTSKAYQIYAVYNNNVRELVDCLTTPLDVTYSNTIAFPAADNPSSLTGGNLLTVTATSDGGSNDGLYGATCTVTVTDRSLPTSKSGSNTLTLGHSQINGLTYYVETPGTINDYDSGAALKREYSASELTSSVLEIPRGLQADVWIVPVFTNITMYDRTTANGDWKSYGVTTGYSFSGGGITALQPGTSANALSLSGAGAVMVDIGTAINTTLGINNSVMSNGVSHDLAGSAVSASLTVKIADPVLEQLDVERWYRGPNGEGYTSIYNSGNGYKLSGNVGDELKLRVRAIYSDGSSIYEISNSNAYASGVYFLPLDNLNTYIPANGPTTPTQAASFGVGTNAELGVLYGYFMSRYPSAYSALVNPTSGAPSATDWNNNINTTGALQNILDGLTRQIGIHQKTGTTGGITTGYLTASNGLDIVPGHFAVQLNQAGSYTLDFSGTYKANGYNSATSINGISGSPLVIELTVAPPTVERVYLASDDLAYSQTASSTALDCYVFDKTSTDTFRVYPVILDSSYYLTSEYAANNSVLPDRLSLSSVGAIAGVNYVLNTDWPALVSGSTGIIGNWYSSDPNLSIVEKIDPATSRVYLEVKVLSLSDIDSTSPACLKLALQMSTSSVVVRYNTTSSSPSSPIQMGVYTTTNPIVQDINIKPSYISGSGGASASVEVNRSIYFPVTYTDSGSSQSRGLYTTEYPGVSGTTNVLVVTSDPSNPGTCSISVDSSNSALRFTPSAVGTYSFQLSTTNASGVIIPTAAQGARTITFTATPQTLTATLYYGENILLTGLLPSGTASLVETSSSAQLDAAALAAGRLKMTANQSGSATVEVRNASGMVLAEIQIALTACTATITLEPVYLTDSSAWYRFANGEIMQLQWKTTYTKPSTTTVTCAEYSDVTGGLNKIGGAAVDFLTLSGSTLKAQDPTNGASGILHGIYSAVDAAGATHVIFATLNPAASPPSYSYVLHDSSGQISNLSLTVGQTQDVYVYDSVNSTYISSFTVSSDTPSIAGVTNLGSSAQIEGWAAGTATITFSPLQGGGSVTLPVTVNAPVPSTYSVSGYVQESGTNAAIGGATVTLTDTAAYSDTATTDASGYYTFANLADGTYTVTVTAATGYTVPASTSVTVAGTNITAATIYLNLTSTGVLPATIQPGTISIEVGSQALATVGITGTLSGSATYVWTIDAPTVAQIGTATGSTVTILGVGVGTATLTCTITDGGNTYVGTATVTVAASTKSATLDPDPIVLTVGDTVTVEVVSTVGLNAPLSYAWSIIDSAIAGLVAGTATGSTVDITALNVGTTNLWCTITDAGGVSYTAIVAITVSSSVTPPVLTYEVSGIVTDASTGGTLANAAVTLGASTATSNGGGNYSFTGVSDGIYTLTVSLTDYDPWSDSVTVNGGNVTRNVALTPTTVTPIPTPTATLTLSTNSVTVGSTATATVTTSDLSGALSYNWISSNAAIATVAGSTPDNTAIVTGKAIGSAEIRGEVTDQAGTTVTTDPVTITVRSSGSGGGGGGGSSSIRVKITLDQSSVKAGATVKATAAMTQGSSSYTPSNATYAWSSSNESVATISGSGAQATITTVGAGTTTIKVTVTVGSVTYTDSTTLTVTGDSLIFSDISNSWAQEEILALAAMGIINGYLDGTFRPDSSITRGEFIKLVTVALGVDAVTDAELAAAAAHFADWNSLADWVKPYWAAAYANGIANGSLEDGIYYTHSDSNITRAEAAVVLANLLTRAGVLGTMTGAELSFSDALGIPVWAADQVALCVENGLMNGYSDNSVRPLNNITRAESAAVIYRYLDSQ